jgi:hypothetical protein
MESLEPVGLRSHWSLWVYGVIGACGSMESLEPVGLRSHWSLWVYGVIGACGSKESMELVGLWSHWSLWVFGVNGAHGVFGVIGAIRDIPHPLPRDNEQPYKTACMFRVVTPETMVCTNVRKRK